MLAVVVVAGSVDVEDEGSTVVAGVAGAAGATTGVVERRVVAAAATAVVGIELESSELLEEWIGETKDILRRLRVFSGVSPGGL